MDKRIEIKLPCGEINLPCAGCTQAESSKKAEVSLKKEEERSYPGHRLLFAIFLLLLSTYIIKTFHFSLLYSPSYKNGDIPRFTWCVAFSLMGFGLLLISRLITSPDWKEKLSLILIFISYYIPMLFVISGIVFSGCMLFNKISEGYLFYYLSASLCLFLSFQADYIDRIFVKLLTEQKLK